MLDSTPDAGARVEAESPRPLPGAEPRSGGPSDQGQRFGDYELEEEIAHGGMGVVYRARQVSLGRTVALKLLLLGRYSSAESVERFRREAQSVAALRHPNIVAIHEVGEHQGQQFFSMDYVEGSSLAQLLRGGPLPDRRAAELTRDIARAIHYAHQQGVLHRDLKPSNVLVDASGEVRITDFGLAKRLDGSTDLTVTGQMVGTPNYLSPEQAAGQHTLVGPPSDVYAMGALLYELVTGRPPFLAQSLQETLLRIRDNEPVSPRALNPGLARDLETICLKCLHKEPSRRFASADELASDLDRWLGQRPILARPTGGLERTWLWCRRKPRQAAVLACLGFSLLALLTTLSVANVRVRSAHRAAHMKGEEGRQLLLRRYVAEGNRLVEQGNPLGALPWLVKALEMEQGDTNREPQERMRLAYALQDAPEFRHHIHEGRWVQCVTYSPDGRLLAFGSDNHRLRVLEVTSGQDRFPPILMPAGVAVVEFSPDGLQVLGMDMAGWLGVWNATNGAPIIQPLRPPDYDADLIGDVLRRLKPSAAFSPDGLRIVAAWGCKAAHVWEVAGARHVYALKHRAVVYHAGFSPDGRHIATASRDREVRIWDSATGEQAAAPLKHRGVVDSAQFSRDGEQLLTLHSLRIVQRWNWRLGERVGEAIEGQASLLHQAYSPDGTMFVVVGWDRIARVYRASDGELLKRFEHPSGIVHAAFSPDGKRLATACHDGSARVWDVDAAGVQAIAVLPNAAEVDRVRFSPDGRQLAVAGFGGFLRVWDLSPSREVVRTHESRDLIRWAELEPGGHRYLVAGGGPPDNVQVFETDTGRLVSSASISNGVWRARFSPDGARYLVFGSSEKVQICDARTGRELIPGLIHRAEVEDAQWSPNGRFIAAGAGRDGARLWDAGTGALIRHYPTSNRLGVVTLAFSPDGRFLATGIRDREVLVWDTTTNRLALPRIPSPERVRDVRISPDGCRLAFSSHTHGSLGSVQVCDLRTGAVIGRPMAHLDEVLNISFTADGRWLLSSGEDYRARVWDVETTQPVSPWMAHADEVRDAALSPDGRVLATLTSSGEVRLWHPCTGEPITRPLRHAEGRRGGRVSFSPDGRRLLVAATAREAWLCDLPGDAEPLETLRHRAEILSCHEVDASGSLAVLDASSLSNAWARLSQTPLQK